MSYEVLARKWRPKNFEQLVGQEQTATALINSLSSGRLHHAYLFTGTRGVGKTTIARIFSKSINCERGISANPCGECGSCVAIDEGNFVDLLEIDAASRTKVEDTRELLDNVQYRPSRGRYKVYLIDEVHMLSGHSFNALLKTLEEPPPHVIFLLATTDPQKLPVTVLSRCLQFSLRRMEETEIVNHLSKVLDAESIPWQSDAIGLIAQSADGSMRDALSLLDQAIVYSAEQITLDVVQKMLGSVDSAVLYELLNAVAKGDAAEALGIIARAAEYSPDYAGLIDDWLRLLHQLAIAMATGQQNSTLLSRCTNDNDNQISAQDIQLFYQLSIQSRRDLAWSPQPRQALEMMILRCISFRPLKITAASQSAESTNSAAEVKKKAINSSPGEISDSVSNQSAISKESSPSKTEPSSDKSISDSGEQFAPSNLEDDRPQVSSKPSWKNDVTNENGTAESVSSSDISVDVVDKEPISNDQLLNKQLSKEALPVFDDINDGNWYRVVAACNLQGQGEQILLNSLASIEGNKLNLNIAQNMAVLLSDSVQNSISQTLRHLYPEQTFQVTFMAATLTSETPRDRAIRLHQQQLDELEADLLQNQQIQYLINELDCQLDKSTLTILTKHAAEPLEQDK